MEKKETDYRIPDKKLASVCGLFCPSCTVFIGTKEDPERLKEIAERLQLTPEQLECHGCRADKRCFYCASCKKTTCAAAKGISFCGECPEYSCEELVIFQKQMPHRIELWEYQERIKEVGYEQWYQEMIEHYSCPECGTINSVYDLACRKCQTTPSCNYVSLHKEKISQHLNTLILSNKRLVK